jgi:hypothetical protein
MCVPFDMGRLEVLGGGIPIIENGLRAYPHTLPYEISSSGTLAYILETTGEPTPGRTLVWVDLEGNEEPIEAPSKMYFWPSISPDGSKVAIQVRGNEQYLRLGPGSQDSESNNI